MSRIRLGCWNVVMFSMTCININGVTFHTSRTRAHINKASIARTVASQNHPGRDTIGEQRGSSSWSAGHQILKVEHLDPCDNADKHRIKQLKHHQRRFELDMIVANRGYPLKMRMDKGPEMKSLDLHSGLKSMT